MAYVGTMPARWPRKKKWKKWFLLLQSLGNSGMLLSMQGSSCGNWKTKMTMNIDELYNMDEVTVLFDTDPLTGEQTEAEQEWTADHERELTALDWAKKNEI